MTYTYNFAQENHSWLLITFLLVIFLDLPKPFGIMTTLQFQLLKRVWHLWDPVGNKIQTLYIRSRKLKMKKTANVIREKFKTEVQTLEYKSTKMGILHSASKKSDVFLRTWCYLGLIFYESLSLNLSLRGASVYSQKRWDWKHIPRVQDETSWISRVWTYSYGVSCTLPFHSIIHETFISE